MKIRTRIITRCLPCASLALALAALFHPLRTSAAGPPDTNWVKDPITGCAVWTGHPTGKEMPSWSGSCQDGKAEGLGVLCWFADGKLTTRFTGTMVAGKAQGSGQLDFWLDNGYAHYAGEMKDSQMHGRGVLVLPDGIRAEGDFQNGNLDGFVTYTQTNGASYIGEMKNNEPHGQGRQILPGQHEYFGEFKHGKREGQGTLLLPNGDIYVGEFKNDQAEGSGTLLTAQGASYQGPFQAGKPHGEGVFTAPGGDVTPRRVVDGELDGKLIYTLRNGGAREETWEEGNWVNP